eukprot:PhF_6_TR25173/c0_g1_i2/m.34709
MIACNHRIIVVVFAFFYVTSVSSEQLCTHDVDFPVKSLKYTGPGQIYDPRKRERCFQGQHYEDLYLYQHFLHKTYNGVFLELGALDGYSYSATYFFERYMGWRGILIEASPRNVGNFWKQQGNPKTKRFSGTEFVHSAICSEKRNVTYVSVSGTGAGILEFMSNKQQKQYEHAEKMPIGCDTLNNILESKEVDHVDMFVLDVEGAEYEVLKGFDISKIPVHYLVVEMDGHNATKDKLVRCYLKENKFEYIGSLMINEIWRSTTYDVTKYKPKEQRVTSFHPSKCFVTHSSSFLTPLGGGGAGVEEFVVPKTEISHNNPIKK